MRLNGIPVNHLKRPVFTVGHSNLALGRFLNLLHTHRVTAVADVRSQPYSGYNPSFNREDLRHSLASHGIAYIFMGHELGARSEDPGCYVGGRVQYRLLARTDLFKKGIERVIDGADRHRIALMCAEREPLHCHRAILVARILNEQGLSVGHIHPDGPLETHDSAMRRLLDLVGLPSVDLFRTWTELLDEGLRLQESKIAYVSKKMAAKKEISNQ